MIVMLNSILQLYFLFLFNKYFFNKRKIEKFFSNSCIILSTLILCILLYNYQNSLIYLFIFILYFFFIYILYSSKWYKILMHTIVFCIISFCSIMFSTLITYLFFNMKRFPKLNTFDYSLYLLFCFILLYYFLKIYIDLYSKILNFDLPKFVSLVYLFPSFTLFFILISDNFYTLLRLDLKSFIMIFSLLFTNIILFIIYINLVQTMNYKNRFEILNYREKYSSKKYDLLNIQYKNNFHFLHDLLNEYQKIDFLMNNNDFKLAQEQLHNLANLTYHNFNDLYTDSIVLNYLLNNKKEIIETNNIQILSLLQYTDFTFMDFCDQIDFFSISLDYLIKNTIPFDGEKLISIKSSMKNNLLILNFQFTSNNYEINKKEIDNLTNSILKSYD